MEHAVTGFDSHANGRRSIILALPFLPIEGGLAKNGVNQRRIISRPKSDQGTECGIRFRRAAVLRDVTAIEKPLELSAVFRFSQRADNVENGAVAILLRYPIHGLLSQHILPQRGKHGFRPVGKRHVMHNIACEYGKAVGQSSDVKFHAIMRILDIELRIELFLALLVFPFRNAVIVTAAIKVNPIPTDRFFGISFVPADLQLHHRISCIPVVNVEEVHTFRDNEPHSSIG